ncbi:hypothetical protein PGT21_032246 [Puccinia graminis f. sp. tritici]|uniref:Uncharacterized protein n=1 Tax=Puccinia graminis f. sp. tritici TaxID=56615 RepID=A0A5B0R5L9_PUCGR|nr:hypothetical protein PGT21_032246 [Puccinia graminis f. sp. tritici]KAA1120603.1 hypothetical protein PGTUg99_007376 [Puccinia graminis f. sp. tritici]
MENDLPRVPTPEWPPHQIYEPARPLLLKKTYRLIIDLIGVSGEDGHQVILRSGVQQPTIRGYKSVQDHYGTKIL